MRARCCAQRAHISLNGPEWPLTGGDGGDGNIDGLPKEKGQRDGDRFCRAHQLES
jgi:hypothetical protein